MAAVLAFESSVTSKILPGGKGVLGSLFQALTGTVSSYEHISASNFHYDGYPASITISEVRIVQYVIKLQCKNESLWCFEDYHGMHKPSKTFLFSHMSAVSLEVKEFLPR
ncbi:hypothetical protein POTOM_034075 [Populus tomentosa]|uniref:Uncharacterized protein n=1 Tax=Populus tomentosa TaxID=118781 RepID=A0A8X7YY08_POPTO|nr:hypothetical protein POTOM_034075 [Populus tomentosa]